MGERVGAAVLKFTDVVLVGRLKKYRAIEADCIAAAMIHLALSKPPSGIVISDELQELGGDR
jgi:hypothetical protein